MKAVTANLWRLAASGGVRNSVVSGGGSGSKLLTISGSDSSTHVKWNLSTTYDGAFRLNVGTFGSLAGNMASQDYNNNAAIGLASSSKLLITGGSNGDSHRSIGEYNIPTPSTSTSLSALPIASNSQNYIDAFGAAPSNPGNWTTAPKVGGICTYNGRVMVNFFTFYDASNTTDRSVMVLNSATTLSASGARGFWPVLANPQTSHASGWISPVPASKQAAFGGTHIFGQSTSGERSIHSRFPIGPSAFVYNADASNSVVGESPLANGSTLSVTNCLDYSLANGIVPEALLGSTGQKWTHLSTAQYGFLVPGTRTYAVLGWSAGHGGGSTYGVSPWDGHQGFYRNLATDQYNYYWFFDEDDLLAVKAGTKQPYEVQPYEYGELPLPFDGGNTTSLKPVGGAAFDPATGKLYVALEYADTSQASGSSGVALILRYSLGGLSS